MPAKGRPWDRERTKFKTQCKQRNEQCWLCHNTKGPIDYESKFDPKRPNPLLFSVDHMDPTSIPGNDAMRVDRWKPAHISCNTSRGNGTRGQFPTTRQW